MAYITAFLLFFSYTVYADELFLKEEEAKIYVVHQDTVIDIDPSHHDRLIQVENQDLDTFGSLTIKGQTIHSASWMGPYGNYLIHLPANTTDVNFQVKPLESKADTTTVKLTMHSLEHRSSQFLTALQNYTQANDLRIKQYLGHANQTKQAIEDFKTALNGFAQEDAGFFLGLSHFELGIALLEVGAQVEGLEHLEQSVAVWSLTHPKQSLRAINAVGLAYWKTGQLKKALHSFEKIIQVYTTDLNPLVLAQAINNSGLINLELGEFTEAKSRFKKSLNINGVDIDLDQSLTTEMVTAINNSGDLTNTAATLNNLALVYDALGEPERAEVMWLAYIEISKNLSNPTTLAKAENNLAMHYLRKGHYEEAQQWLESAEKIFIQNTHTRWLSLVQQNLGVLYDELGLIDLAEIYYKKALQLRAQINHPTGHMESLYRLANINRKKHHVLASLQLNQDLLTMAETHNDLRFKALSHLNQYAIYQQQGDLNRAEKHINQAIQLINNSPYQRLSSKIKITQAEFLMATNKYAEASHILESEVKTLEKIWNTRLLNRANNLLARAHYLNQDYNRAQQVINKELSNINFYLNNTANTKIASHLQGLLKETLNINALILHQLGASQQGFIQTMQHSQQFQRLQKNLQDGIQSDNQRVAEWLQTIKDKSKALENRLLSLGEKERLEENIIELKAKIDFSYQRSSQAEREPLRLSDIQKQIEAETVLLVYSIGETDGLSWWISRDQFITHKVPGKKPLKKLIALSREELTGRRSSYQHSKQLSHALTQPLAEFGDIKTIKLIADEPLNLVPFSSLQDIRQNHTAPIVATSRVQRVRSLQAINRSPELLVKNARALVVADPIYNVDDSRLTVKPSQQDGLKPYPRLSNTHQESELIKAQLNATVMAGFDANKAQLLSTDLSPFNVLHIASHAFFHPEIPGLSSLVLSAYAENGQPQQSAYLRALDITELNNQFDLTVLSACETGIGEVDDALGLTGLTESFLQAGSDYVISSLWQVDDQASSRFMAYFYTNLSTEVSIDQAFWSAQKAMLKNPRTRHPKYWAGWFLIKQ